jgi:3-hydroxypropionyl-coenzyme A dehydratase
METISLERKDGVVKLILNRPDKLNAINPTMLQELGAILSNLIEDDSVKVLVVTGAGRAFCAGADVNEFTKLTPSSALKFSRNGKEIMRSIENFPVPTVAAINGYALGGGLELALSCDIRIASSAAQLGLPEINLGIFPGFGGTVRLPRLIGKAKALELMYTGDRVSAEEAMRLGLVNRMVQSEKFEEEVTAFTSKLASKSPAILRLLKASVNASSNSSEEVGSEVESLAWASAFSTDDQKEGVKAFLERREPKFLGR